MKQMEVTRKKIGEYTYYIRPFPAFTASNISGELSQVIAPVIGGLAPAFSGTDEKFDIGEMELDDALPAFANALGSLSGDKLEHLMVRLLVQYKNISVKGEATDGDTTVLDMDLANEIFCGDLQDMFVLCFEVVKVNFGGFFKKLETLFGGLQGLTAKKEESEDTES